jgi:hypothetical protein
LPSSESTPLQSNQASFLCLGIEPDRKDILRWSNVPTDQKIRLLALSEKPKERGDSRVSFYPFFLAA